MSDGPMNPGNTTESMYEIFEKRRNYPRLQLNLPVIITGAGGNNFTGTIYDLSPDGVQLRYAIKDGLNLFPVINTRISDIKSLKCVLQFELVYDETSVQVVLETYPIYLRAENENTLSAGMYFSKINAPAESKKVNDFLFHKLETSYSELEYLKDKIAEAQTKKEDIALQQNSPNPEALEAEKNIPAELEKLVSTTRNASPDVEQLKHLLIHVLSSLKVIIELSRNTNERIHIIEHKIAKKTDSV